jgi:hypothetical protein
MAKVFRFHEGVDTIEGWANSAPYGRNAIDAIKDPDGETSAREITSIPSPFARMDLVKTAFEKVCRSEKGLDADTSFHKMVSDTLDVAEIFFNLDRLRDKVRVIVWNKQNSIHALLNSSNRKHRQLGQTLDLYLKQDEGYNFDRLENIYLLDYIPGPQPMNIIGGTSSRTLFFTNANDLSYVDIQFGTDRVFDKEYRPLHLRDNKDFIEYFYALRASDSSFRQLFKEFDEYLEKSFNLLSDQLKSNIKNFDHSTFLQKFNKISVSGDNQFIEVLNGFFLGTHGGVDIHNSDFVLDSKAEISPMPLALPNSNHTLRLTYTTSVWEPDYRAPFVDSRDMAERTLPHVGDKYPYLTVDDFLQPYLIQTVYPIDKARFFDGNANGFDQTEGCILPLKRKYFEYFSSDDLNHLFGDGKKAFEINKGTTGGVTVTLRLPIQKGNYVTFERTYYPSSEPELRAPDTEIGIDRNKGGLITNTFGLAIFPNYRLVGRENQYRVAFYEQDVKPYSKNNNYKLSFGQFYNNIAQPVSLERIVDKSSKDIHAISSKLHLTNGNFDYIEIDDGNGHTGMIIPRFQIKNSIGSAFKVAIDFGTTNTHIELSINGSEPDSFQINEGEEQMMTFHEISLKNYEQQSEFLRLNGLDISNRIDKELKPLYLNKTFNRFFPQRTAVFHKSDLNINNRVDAMLDINIPFFYEKAAGQPQYEIYSDLKWSQFQVDDKSRLQVESYFGSLLLLIRNKIVLNGGDLDKTELVWFYPSSMSTYKITTMDSLWKELGRKFLSERVVINKLSESVAPFYYYKKRLAVSAGNKPVISIDIGGGTSDVVVYQNNKANLLTSFKFAGNALYGDGFNSNPNMNGFVQKYLELIKQKIVDNGHVDLLRVIESIEQKGSSSDMISFFFSLEKNTIFNNKAPISFSKMLHDDPVLKPVILLFFSSILYHVAELMKAQNLEQPRYLIFSGTGSMIVNTIDSSEESELINHLASEIFSQVYKEERSKIEFRKVQNPKEITCKGGLFMDIQDNVDLHDIKRVHLGDKGTNCDEVIKYNHISQSQKNGVIQGMQDFLDIFKMVDGNIRFTDKFGLHPIDHSKLQEVIMEDALEAINTGIEQKRKELDSEDAEVNETLFFYPLIKGLNKYAHLLSKL